MQKYIDMLNKDLRYIDQTIEDDTIIFGVESTIELPVCPYCGETSNRNILLIKKATHLLTYISL